MDASLETPDQTVSEPAEPVAESPATEVASEMAPNDRPEQFDDQCTRGELLWRLYADNREYARAHESQRSAAANLIVAISAGLLGLATFDQKLTVADLPLTLFLMLVGLFGAVFSSKHYERTRLHLNRARQYLRRLNDLFPEDRIVDLQKQGDAENERAFPRLYHLKLNSLWNGFYLLISFLGFVLSSYILTLAFTSSP